MPAQSLRTPPPEPRYAAPPSPGTRMARWATFGGSALLTSFATYQMAEVVAAETTPLQYAMVGLFAITFAWIALSATAAVCGLLVKSGPSKAGRAAHHAVNGRTALIMPIRNEKPWMSFSSLEAMAKDLIDRGLTPGFEIFVLSDTTDPDIWLAETACFEHLRAGVGERIPVWYRRRASNEGRKAGNVRDFVSRWGARYDFMVVLDADSILSAQALSTLIGEMQADPDLGILQSVPRLAGGKTFFARLQQFAGRVYGPAVARGLAAWQGDDGNYWGHNAVIRVKAFAAAAGLPSLSGPKPFGGEILSHDFVEAALVRRAGWSVRMLPALEGSWEEGPPSLLETAARDRRWAQGNIQHLAVVRAAGLAWPSRLHFLFGVMSYAASPLWLALIAIGLALAFQAGVVHFDYFPEGLSLFPTWPRFDAERMVWLFALAMSVLLLPKMIGLACALLDSRLRKSLGAARLAIGVLIETLASALYAPIMMMMQSRQIWEILGGADSGWGVQRREAGPLPWRTLIGRHWLHTFLGLTVCAGLALLSHPLLGWMAPTLLGLVLAVPLSRLSGSSGFASLLRRWRLFEIPEEADQPAVMRMRDTIAHALRVQTEGLCLKSLVADEQARIRHFSTVLPPPPRPRGQPDLPRLTARQKIRDAESLDEALGWLTLEEQLTVLGDSHLFQDLLRPIARGAGSEHDGGAIDCGEWAVSRTISGPNLSTMHR
jgi:membrane glycosyltransferase